MIGFNATRLWITVKNIRDVFLKYLEDFKDGREGRIGFNAT